MSLKSTIDSLPEEERNALYYAFDSELSYHVIFDEGRKFIGVNVTEIPYLHADPDLSKGAWSVGRVGNG